MTYEDFVKSIKDVVFPDREASNLVKAHNKYILDALIEVQRRIPELRDCNISSYSFLETLFACLTTIVTKPDGPIRRVYTISNQDECTKLFYQATTIEHIHALMRQSAVCGYVAALGTTTTTEPVPTTAAREVTDDTENDITISVINVVPSRIVGGTKAVGIITMSDAAPVGGIQVSVSSDSDLLKVPSKVTVSAGSNTVSFNISTSPTDAAVEANIFAEVVLSDGTQGLGLGVAILPEAITDKGYRAPMGYYASNCNRLQVWPHIESDEQLIVEWQGIKTSYAIGDIFPFGPDIVGLIELYVQAQAALREDCDNGKFAALMSQYTSRFGEIAWWYRHKYYPAEEAWRKIACCCGEPVMISGTGTGGGEVPPPPVTVRTVYLGNSGPVALPQYTADDLAALENPGFSPTESRSKAEGTYQIGAPSSGLNEFRLMCFPQEMWDKGLDFNAGALGLPMEEMPDQVVIGNLHYRVFRTTVASNAPFTFEQNTAIVVTQQT